MFVFTDVQTSKSVTVGHFSKNGEERDVSRTEFLRESTFSTMVVRTCPQAELSQG